MKDKIFVSWKWVDEQIEVLANKEARKLNGKIKKNTD